VGDGRAVYRGRMVTLLASLTLFCLISPLLSSPLFYLLFLSICVCLFLRFGTLNGSVGISTTTA
jgi:hypothetical protein